MAHRDTSDDNVDRVWELIEKVGICMLTTRFAGGLRARPLDMRPHRATGSIWFLTDARSAKDHEIGNAHDVGLVVIDSQDSAYLSITGRAEIFRDSAKAADIWKATDRMWWPDGPDDANLKLLRVELRTAELWDGPASAVVAAFELVKTKVTGQEPNLGQNRKVTITL
jgi:general stress protein 26